MQIKFKNIKKILQGNMSKDKIYQQRKSNKIKLLMQKGSRIKGKIYLQRKRNKFKLLIQKGIRIKGKFICRGKGTNSSY